MAGRRVLSEDVKAADPASAPTTRIRRPRSTESSRCLSPRPV